MRSTRASIGLLCVTLLVAGCGGGDDDDAASDDSATTTSAAAADAAPPTDEMVDIGGRSLHVVCEGEGEPAVVVEMGAGQKVPSWRNVLEGLGQDHRTCVYERAGTGDSEPGEEPRTSQVIADELDALLTAADIPTPVIVLSHSIGGLHAQAFAQQHPDRVAGLVFLDPRLAEYQLAYRDLLSPEELAEDADNDAFVAANEPFGPEIAAIDVSAAAVADAGDLPDVPVVVLTAGVPSPGQPQPDIDLWRASHERLAASVTDGRATVVDGAEHELWRTHLDVVLDAVAEVTEKAAD